MKKLSINIILFALAATIVACSFVEINPQAKNIIVAPTMNTLSRCKFLGNITVSLWSSAETFQSKETVENQLNTLARNEAAKMGGDVVTPDSKIKDGQRTYRVYNCSSQYKD